MHKSIPTIFLLILSGHLSAKGLFFGLNIGVSDSSQEIQADIVHRFNELAAFKAVSDYRLKTPYHNTVEGGSNNNPPPRELFAQEIFVEGDPTNQPWEGVTSKVHLLNYRLLDNNQRFRILDDILVDESVENYADRRDNFSVTYAEDRSITGTDDAGYPISADSTPSSTAGASQWYPNYSGEVITITALSAEGASFQIPVDETTQAEMPAYTTASYKSKHRGQSSPADDNRYLNAYADQPLVIMSTSNFDHMMQLRSDLENTVGGNTASLLYGQERSLCLDAGFHLTYDSGQSAIKASATFHHPLPAESRRSIDLITYEPGMNIDAQLGVSINCGQGKVGAALGLSNMKGDIILSPIRYTDMHGNSYPVEYIDHDASYTQGSSSRTLENINEYLYFAELNCESNPKTDRRISIYGKYRMSIAVDTTLEKLKLSQNSIAIGATFNMINFF